MVCRQGRLNFFLRLNLGGKGGMRMGKLMALTITLTIVTLSLNIQFIFVPLLIVFLRNEKATLSRPR